MTHPTRDGADRSDATLPDLIELLPEPCALIDAHGTVQAANAAWRDVFFHTGVGSSLSDACAALFRWAPEEWGPVAAELDALLAGALPRVCFEAVLAEPPERWCLCNLAPIAAGGFVWQLSDVTRWQMAEAEASQVLRQFREAVESISDGFALFDADDRLIFCNRRFRALYHLLGDMLTPGRAFGELVRAGVQRGQYMAAPADEDAYVAERLASHRSGEPVEYQLSDGRWVRSVDRPMPGGGTVGVRTDITELRRAEELRRQSAEQEATIRGQAALLAELSTPILRIAPGAIVLPLVGSLDSFRAGRIVEALLASVAEQRAELVILDITGVPLVDTQVANALLQAARAVQLLGARTVLTGIRPDVAQTIVALGVDLSGIVTRADREGGVSYALGGGG